MTLGEVLETVEGYVLGVADQDAVRLRSLFADSAMITGRDEGQWISVPRDRWVEFVCAPDRRGWGQRDFAVTTTAIEATVATAVVETVYGRFRYRDMLLIGAHPEGLRVLCKAFHQLDGE